MLCHNKLIIRFIFRLNILNALKNLVLGLQDRKYFNQRKLDYMIIFLLVIVLRASISMELKGMEKSNMERVLVQSYYIIQ